MFKLQVSKLSHFMYILRCWVERCEFSRAKWIC